MGWIEQAFAERTPTETDDGCSPQPHSSLYKIIDSCEDHKWVNKQWFEERFPDLVLLNE